MTDTTALRHYVAHLQATLYGYGWRRNARELRKLQAALDELDELRMYKAMVEMESGEPVG